MGEAKRRKALDPIWGKPEPAWAKYAKDWNLEKTWTGDTGAEPDDDLMEFVNFRIISLGMIDMIADTQRQNGRGVFALRIGDPGILVEFLPIDKVPTDADWGDAFFKLLRTYNPETDFIGVNPDSLTVASYNFEGCRHQLYLKSRLEGSIYFE